MSPGPSRLAQFWSFCFGGLITQYGFHPHVGWLIGAVVSVWLLVITP